MARDMKIVYTNHKNSVISLVNSSAAKVEKSFSRVLLMVGNEKDEIFYKKSECLSMISNLSILFKKYNNAFQKKSLIDFHKSSELLHKRQYHEEAIIGKLFFFTPCRI